MTEIESESKKSELKSILKRKRHEKHENNVEKSEVEKSSVKVSLNLGSKKKLKKKKKDKKWDQFARIKPNPLDRENERRFVAIATKGVVQLFNAVNQHQSGLAKKLTSSKTVRKEEKTLKSLKKDDFYQKLDKNLSKNDHNAKKHKKSGSIKKEIKQEFDDQDDFNGSRNENDDDDSKKWKVFRDDYLSKSAQDEENMEE